MPRMWVCQSNWRTPVRAAWMRSPLSVLGWDSFGKAEHRQTNFGSRNAVTESYFRQLLSLLLNVYDSHRIINFILRAIARMFKQIERHCMLPISFPLPRLAFSYRALSYFWCLPQRYHSHPPMFCRFLENKKMASIYTMENVPNSPLLLNLKKSLVNPWALLYIKQVYML